MRDFIISRGIGFEKSSNSLQYLQARLQRRIGMICAITGWSVEATPFAIILSSRMRRLAAITRPRTPGDNFDIRMLCNYNIIDAATGSLSPCSGNIGTRVVKTRCSLFAVGFALLAKGEKQRVARPRTHRAAAK